MPQTNVYIYLWVLNWTILLLSVFSAFVGSTRFMSSLSVGPFEL